MKDAIAASIITTATAASGADLLTSALAGVVGSSLLPESNTLDSIAAGLPSLSFADIAAGKLKI